jgi:nucleotide-binding universal stress UspA family protein
MSAYKTILIVFRSPDDAQCLCSLASDIATRWQSHIVGLYARPALSVHIGLRGKELQEWLADKRKLIDQYNTAIKKSFDNAAGSTDLNWEWRELADHMEPSGDAALEMALCSDLTIIDRLERGSSLVDPDVTLEQLVFGSGRPVLIVPPGCKHQQLGRRMIVAWNGTRESSRAAFDALPLITSDATQAARLVCPPAPERGPRQLPLGAEFAESLARHEIELEVKALPGRHSNAGPEILAECEEFGADLVVMGAYGHSRLREYVFGGTTETILNDCTLPMLISH